MAADLRSSLFGDEVQVEGPEIRFRATCALGWSLLERLPELRSISDSLEVHWLDWILRIEIEVRRVLEQFTSKHAGDWPEHITNALRFLAEQPDVRSFNSIAAFLKQVGEDVKHPDALDPALQLSCFNKRGFDLASRMFSSREWSTDFVRDRWRLGRPAAWSFRADECGSFQPVTSSSNDQIQLRVDTRTFDLKNAVVSYLTLDFQMMHEYVSHFLPVWHSGNTLEEEYLLATTFLFYRAERRPRDGIHVFLVGEADRRQPTNSHQTRRRLIRDELAPMVGEKRLTQLLLRLAVLDEDEMSGVCKRRLLALLNRVPANDPQVNAGLERSLRADSLDDILAELSRAFPVPS